MGLAKYLPGGEKSPGGMVHRGINKAIGIDENFLAPDPLQQRLEANRTGDSQWQKFNPTNIRDYNADFGHDYAGGGRDPIADKVGKPPSEAIAPPPPAMGGAPQGGIPGGAPPTAPPGANMGPQLGNVQRQFAQASQLRGRR